MQITASYKVEILQLHTPLKKTLKIYREAVDWLLPVIDSEWDRISAQDGPKRQFNYAEHLIHKTKDNEPDYPFDEVFPKMPSYFRRSVLQKVLGTVRAYHTNMDKWKEGGEQGNKPKLRSTGHAMPAFYKDQMYKEKDGEARLKLYSGTDWVWYPIRLRKTDVDYLRKYWTGVKASAPTLIKKHKKYYLVFTFQKEVQLPEKEAGKRVICGVDLGINTDAVCSIMQGDGTVVARKFINFPTEKDRLLRVCNRTRKKQRQYGPKAVSGLWNYAKRINDDLAIKVSREIVRFAKDHQADVIVFEYLETKGKTRGRNAQKLHMWKKKDIQNITERLAHRNGMRISRVCARNTSALAFDGSGPVRRDKNNHSLCTFRNGKKYNCDLSASYNIGARYFIREFLKPFSARERSELEANVLRVPRRSSCVYADLLDLLWRMEIFGMRAGSLTAVYDYCGDAGQWRVELKRSRIRRRPGLAA